MSDTSIIDFQLKMVIGELFVKIYYFCLEKDVMKAFRSKLYTNCYLYLIHICFTFRMH